MIEANGTEIEESSDGISRRKPLSSPKSTRPRKNRAEPRSAKSRSVQKKAASVRGACSRFVQRAMGRWARRATRSPIRNGSSTGSRKRTNRKTPSAAARMRRQAAQKALDGMRRLLSIRFSAGKNPVGGQEEKKIVLAIWGNIVYSGRDKGTNDCVSKTDGGQTDGKNTTILYC